jgi:hypothetical protein
MNTATSPTNQGVSADEALALAQVRKLRGFHIHLAQYAVTVLSIVNLITYPRYFWVLWVALGWGIGVLFHGLRVFDKVPFLSGEWERRQVRSILDASSDVARIPRAPCGPKPDRLAGDDSRYRCVGWAKASAVARRAKAEACLPFRMRLPIDDGLGASAPFAHATESLQI